MNQKQIARRKANIEKKIMELEDELYGLQIKCSHEGHLVRYWSDTGNWDKGQDYYGEQHTCHNCGKIWNEGKFVNQ